MKTRPRNAGGVSPAAAAGAAPTRPTPLDLLLGYQRRWVEDGARFKLGLMSRQVGKDFSAAAEGIRDCWRHELAGTKTTWMIAAPSERQSLASLEKWKEWAQAFGLSVAANEVLRETNAGKRSESLLKSATIVFPHGSRVIAVPGKPDTVRGESANVLFTEFGFFEQPEETWRALFASVANPLRGGQKKVRIISTPNGQGNKLHALWSRHAGTAAPRAATEAAVPAQVRARIEEARRNAPPRADGQPAGETELNWSCHRTTIYDAVADGLPANLYELYAGMDDADGWAQEFECEFLDAAAVLLPYELIAGCECAEATTEIEPAFWRTAEKRPLFIGWDFARKHDLSVVWTAERVGEVLHTREVAELRNLATPAQVEAMRPRMEAARRVCVDYTGPGIGLGDLLVAEYGEYRPSADLFGKIELCTFTPALKLELFPALKVAFEQRRLRVPVSRAVREDLHSLQRVVTAAGNVSYRAAHTADGHADRCAALALAVRAAGTGAAPERNPYFVPNPGRLARPVLS